MSTSPKWFSHWSRPPPWHFHAYALGCENVVVSANRQLIVSGVPLDVGGLIAAAPTMYATLYQLARTLHPNDPRAHAIRKALARADQARRGPTEPLGPANR